MSTATSDKIYGICSSDLLLLQKENAHQHLVTEIRIELKPDPYFCQCMCARNVLREIESN